MPLEHCMYPVVHGCVLGPVVVVVEPAGPVVLVLVEAGPVVEVELELEPEIDEHGTFR